MKSLIAVALLFFAGSVSAQIAIERPWVRATAPGLKITAGYMTLRNTAATPDRLVGASSPAAARVETHVHIKDGEILRMREVKGYDLPAKGAFDLKPGGAHLMLVDLKQPLKEGDVVDITLKFEKAKEQTVRFHVGRLAAPPVHHKH